MLATRDQENLAFSHQHGATLKQQQGQANRQLGPKTPGARYPKSPIKVPLNDENGAHAIGGAKNVLGGMARGNENAMTSKAVKGVDKSSFVTPMGPRARAVLGNKTTNAKAKGLQSVNVKSVVQDIEKSQTKLQNTIRPKQKQPQAETQKLQVHTEETDPLSEDEVEYCPPKPKDLPYESDVFPDGVLTFDALKPENMLKGYYRYYFNPIDENGISLHEKKLAEETRKAIEEGERQIKEDLDNFEWCIEDELEPDVNVTKKAPTSAKTSGAALTTKQAVARKPLSTVRSRNAANALSLDDTTKSMQRKASKIPELSRPLHKKSASFAIPSLRMSRPPSSQNPSIPKKASAHIDANSRTTIGYNKGRVTASLLTKGSTATQPNTGLLASAPTYRGAIPRSDTTLSNDSDKTITPARYAHKQASVAAAAEDRQWSERVPFLAIFNPEDCDEDDDPLAIKSHTSDILDDDEEEFELKLVD
ncbi:hypothetical protein F5Y19DRAFT_288726 [Xylariaceae sp. FL1651]|nr:hypothetical protein F5Y19DRAFT_288726 [Xylariaceae sp. FL1651]